MHIIGYAQDSSRYNAAGVDLGGGYLMRQDLLFSPVIHADASIPVYGLFYLRDARLYQQVQVKFAGYTAMVDEPYPYILHGETDTAFPHSFTFVDVDYTLGKRVMQNQHAQLIVGGAFLTDVQAMYYVYGRISSFGYYAQLRLGGFVQYRRHFGNKHMCAASLQLPLVSWVARSPYLVNDDAFIENIISHSGVRTFGALLADGNLTSWHNLQTFDIDMQYRYSVSEHLNIGAQYSFACIHMQEPMQLLSFSNTLSASASFKF